MKIDFVCSCGIEHKLETSVAIPNQTKTLDYELNWSVPNPNISFDNYIVMPENKSVIDDLRDSLRNTPFPGPELNLVCGGMNSGKSHLLSALYHDVNDKTELNVKYLSARQFTREMISSLQTNTFQRYQKEILNFDVLVFDGLEFLSDKSTASSELLSLIMEMNHNQSIVVSFDPSLKKKSDNLEFNEILSRFDKFELEPDDAM